VSVEGRDASGGERGVAQARYASREWRRWLDELEERAQRPQAGVRVEGRWKRGGSGGAREVAPSAREKVSHNACSQQ